jgi:hypothetical protein
MSSIQAASGVQPIGRPNKRVPDELRTVEKRSKPIARVMAKMEVTPLAELVRIADKVGLGDAAATQASRYAAAVSRA